jgi:hypothetical protein
MLSIPPQIHVVDQIHPAQDDVQVVDRLVVAPKLRGPALARAAGPSLRPVMAL